MWACHKLCCFRNAIWPFIKCNMNQAMHLGPHNCLTLIVLTFSAGWVKMHESKMVPQRKNKVTRKKIEWILFNKRKKFMWQKWQFVVFSFWLCSSLNKKLRLTTRFLGLLSPPTHVSLVNSLWSYLHHISGSICLSLWSYTLYICRQTDPTYLYQGVNIPMARFLATHRLDIKTQVDNMSLGDPKQCNNKISPVIAHPYLTICTLSHISRSWPPHGHTCICIYITMVSSQLYTCIHPHAPHTHTYTQCHIKSLKSFLYFLNATFTIFLRNTYVLINKPILTTK